MSSQVNTVEFTKVTCRNFCSVGDVPIEIELNRSATTWIRGRSGAGKSALILDALTFALYGKAFRNINKPTLVNTTNGKNCVVEAFFTVRGGKKYRVVRGIKPTVFEIWEEGVLKNINDKSLDYQDILTNDILKIKENVFRQIVALGSATFVPFMDQPAAKRREIIEDILGTKIFSQMLVVQKEKTDFQKTQMRDLEYKIDVCKEKIELIKKHAADLEQQSAEKLAEYKSKVFEIIAQLEEIDEAIDAMLDTRANLVEEQEKLTKKTSKFTEIEKAVTAIRSERNRSKKEIEFLSKHTQCPTCHQDIEDDFKNAHICTKMEEVAKFDADMKALAEKLSSIQDVFDLLQTITKKIAKLDKEISDKQVTKKTLANQRKFLMQHIEEKVTEKPDLSALAETEETINKHKAKRADLLEEREYLTIAGAILKDEASGIKSKVVSQYLPDINSLLNYYLDFFELSIGMRLGPDFSETFTNGFREGLNYGNFSEGEKQRIDLAIILTFREIAKKRHSVSTNLLVLDEIATGMGQATELLVDLLHKMGDNGTNVFVSSHDTTYSALRSTITVEKVGNFTKIV